MKVASRVGGEAKIPIRNIWHLLLYAWGFVELKGEQRLASEASPSLLALLAHILAGSVRELLRTQLEERFRPTMKRFAGSAGGSS